MEIVACIVLRLVLAWFFLDPVKGLISDWDASVELVKSIIPFQPQCFAILMIIVMIVGSLSVLFGIYAQIGAGCLLIYTLMGVVVHYRLGNTLSDMRLTKTAVKADKTIFETAKALGIQGHMTSAKKNIVIVAALLQIVLLGSGPFSLYP